MSLWGDLEKLKRCRWVDLTHPLTNESPYWGGIPDGSVELCKTVFDYDEEMLSCRIHTYKFPASSARTSTFPCTSFRAVLPPRSSAWSRAPIRCA